MRPTSTRDPRRTRHGTVPDCGGLPQLSFRADTGDALSKAARELQCERCRHSWPYSSSACASCGESEGGNLTFYAERPPGSEVVRSIRGDATFPHLRIESCSSCNHYLIDVDLGLDPRAVPEVDELAALPLDLYAAEQGPDQDHAEHDGVLRCRDHSWTGVRLLHRHQRVHRLQGL